MIIPKFARIDETVKREKSFELMHNVLMISTEKLHHDPL